MSDDPLSLHPLLALRYTGHDIDFPVSPEVEPEPWWIPPAYRRPPTPAWNVAGYALQDVARVLQTMFWQRAFDNTPGLYFAVVAAVARTYAMPALASTFDEIARGAVAGIPAAMYSAPDVRNFRHARMCWALDETLRLVLGAGLPVSCIPLTARPKPVPSTYALPTPFH